MFAFIITWIAFIKSRVTNGEHKADDAADNFETLSQNAEVKKFRKPKEWQWNMQLKDYFLKKKKKAKTLQLE